MAKAKTVKQFLTDLATNPEKLGKFIQNADQVLKDEKIPKKHHQAIKNAVAHHVHGKLSSTPEAYALIA